MGKPHLRDKEKEQIWRKRIAACKASGLTVKAFCEKEGISEHCLYSWRREIRLRDEEAADERKSVEKSSKHVEQSAFVPVRLVPSNGDEEETSSEPIEIIAPNGFHVLLPEGTDAKWMTQILVALHRIC